MSAGNRKRETSRKLMIGAFILGVAVTLADVVYFDVTQEAYIFLAAFTATFAANYNRRRHTDAMAWSADQDHYASAYDNPFLHQ